MIDHILMTDEVFIQRLVGRSCADLDESVRDYFKGSCVLVTGGGGSIGSYLCKVLVECGVARLLIYEQNEFNLYVVNHLLTGKGTAIVPILGDVRNGERLEYVFNSYKIDFVFHAAAYKHVPMVERNPLEGIRTNVFGTLEVLRCAKAHKVPKFLLVSSDKAVNPTSIMGASKRIAEDIVLGGNLDGMVRKAVRFGNVLWSSGSVLPLFKTQLLAGKPVTITHPDVTRYFMSAREAVHLILQAMKLPESGVFVFDMKEPVVIVEMVHRLATILKIKEYDIQVIGLRPGEKLYEELTLGSGLVGTTEAGVRLAEGEERKVKWLDIGHLKVITEKEDVEALRKWLFIMDVGYVSEGDIVDPLWLKKHVENVDRMFGDPYSFMWAAEALK